MKVHTLKAFNDNYIWLLQGQQQAAWAVDPGDASVVEHALDHLGLRLEGILITHHHADHTGGIASLCQHRDIPVYGPREGIPGLTQELAGGETLELPSIGELAVLAVPGHTAGHIAYYVKSPASLFCGDTLFNAGCGRLFEGTAQEMYMSLNSLAALPEHTLIYCAHEYSQANLYFALAAEPDNPAIAQRLETVNHLRAQGIPSVPSSLGEERRYNPFLRCHEPTVCRTASVHIGKPLRPGLDTFTALRRWKDTFRG